MQSQSLDAIAARATNTAVQSLPAAKMLLTRVARACRTRGGLATMHTRGGRAAVRRLHDFNTPEGAAKQHERALEALDAGAPPEAVIPLFEAAAADGHAEAMFFLGLAKAGLLEPDDGTVGGNPPAVDAEGAAAAYAKAAELGCAPAAFNLAHCLRRGDGVAQDEKRAYDYYQQASDAGDARAAFQLGLAADPLHREVQRPGNSKDGDAAVAYYRHAMDEGHLKAAVNLGILHWEPQSLALLKMPEEDRRAVAIECWELAAEAGVQEARDCLRQAQSVWDVKYDD